MQVRGLGVRGLRASGLIHRVQFLKEGVPLGFRVLGFGFRA